jgi:putative addiction module component (TIGR02574 family)
MTQVEHLLSEAMKLDEPTRAELVRRLFATLERADAGLEEAWREEVRHRVTRIRNGEAVLVPWEEAERRLFAK